MYSIPPQSISKPKPENPIDPQVEYVKQEARIVYLLECLQKTAPPALIFCENKADVDDIHEYLLLKVKSRMDTISWTLEDTQQLRLLMLPLCSVVARVLGSKHWVLTPKP
jgi:superfamily II DNA/RNA helicase